MSFALINKSNNNVCQFVATEDECFETHEDYFWKDIPDEFIEGEQPADFKYEPANGNVIRQVYPEPDFHMLRQLDYEDLTVGQQLNLLWKDMDAGLVPGKDGNWFKTIKSIKEKHTE
tara:strand:- start:779 stop:1129 length:351 start_codon:yes stop_codon:yes gene_type:complete